MLAALGGAALPPRVQAQSDQFEKFDCPITLGDKYEVTCGMVTVPEEHQKPDGNTIKVAVAVVKSSAAVPAEPFVMAQGGPGGSTFDLGQNFITVFPIFDSILQKRDIVLVEQRGTLYSEPALYCKEVDELGLKYLEVPLDQDGERKVQGESVEAAETCLARYAREGVNLSAFNSIENAADFPVVMDALGYDKFVFYGVSYGTMLGQHLIRDHGERLVSAILDANVPLSVNYIPNVPTYADRVFRELFMACAADVDCNRAYPNLESRFFALVEQLNDSPLTIPVTDLESGTGYDYPMTGYGLVNYFFQLFYSAPMAIPLIFKQLEEEDVDLTGSILSQILFDRTMSLGMHYTVMCAEDGDYTQEDIRTDGLYPIIGQVFADPEAPDDYLPVCEASGITPLDDYVDDPVVSDVPTLVLSGRFDPITPPLGGEMVVKTLKNGFHFIFPSSGHGAITELTCAPTVITSFLDDPTRPDGACVAQLSTSFALPSGSGGDDSDEAGDTTTEITGDPLTEDTEVENELFSITLPKGWVDQSEGDQVTIGNPDNGAILNVRVVVGDDEQAAELDVRTALGFGDATYNEVGQTSTLRQVWTIRTYTAGRQAVVTLTRFSRDKVIVCVFNGAAEAFQESVPTLRGVFNSIRAK
jgi:pimeloyl-ACP methyl ester carboxylesterase